MADAEQEGRGVATLIEAATDSLDSLDSFERLPLDSDGDSSVSSREGSVGAYTEPDTSWQSEEW